MPSTSNLFFGFVFSLVARCAKTKGEVAFFCRSAFNATRMLFCPRSNGMCITMLLWSNKLKIFKSVILGISVYVVYMYALWGIGYNSMLVLPFIWFCCFYPNIHKSLSRLVQPQTTNRKPDSNFFKHALAYSFYIWGKRFICAVGASRSVMVSIAVGAFFPYDGGAAKRAWFRQKFFHARSVCQ